MRCLVHVFPDPGKLASAVSGQQQGRNVSSPHGLDVFLSGTARRLTTVYASRSPAVITPFLVDGQCRQPEAFTNVLSESPNWNLLVLSSDVVVLDPTKSIFLKVTKIRNVTTDTNAVCESLFEHAIAWLWVICTCEKSNQVYSLNLVTRQVRYIQKLYITRKAYSKITTFFSVHILKDNVYEFR